MTSDLVLPIPGSNPSGQDLRYTDIYDRIKEARRHDDPTLPQGAWEKPPKTADYKRVISIATEALSTKTKDLQIAAWLTDALLKTEGISGLTNGLRLVTELVDKFWDSLYPSIEDGDEEMRSAPLEWIGTRLSPAIRDVALTETGYTLTQYNQSRAVGYESAGNAERYQSAVADGKITADLFDDALKSTRIGFYEALSLQIADALRAARGLASTCERRFTQDSPSFGSLQEALDELKQAVNVLLRIKGSYQIDDTILSASVDPAGEQLPASPTRVTDLDAVRSTSTVKGAEPSTCADAVKQMLAAVSYIRKSERTNVIPYAVLRALRWSELRLLSHPLDSSALAPPSSELRQTLRGCSMNKDWNGLLDAAEGAMEQECGRAWLDIQRHTVKACNELGGDFTAIADLILATLRTLIQDFPELLTLTLSDDTPAANSETQRWLRYDVLRTTADPSMTSTATRVTESHATINGLDGFTSGVTAAQENRYDDAVRLLRSAVMRQTSGRAKFVCKSVLAESCLRAGYYGMAQAILEELVGLIEQHKLAEWESSDEIVRVYKMLANCLDKVDGDPKAKADVYSRICRLDPSEVSPK